MLKWTRERASLVAVGRGPVASHLILRAARRDWSHSTASVYRRGISELRKLGPACTTVKAELAPGGRGLLRELGQEEESGVQEGEWLAVRANVQAALTTACQAVL